jgi:hypothetical protein
MRSTLIITNSSAPTCKDRPSTSCGNIRVKVSIWDTFLALHQNLAKWRIYNPRDLTEGIWALSKIYLLRVIHKTQQTALLISSTKNLSFNGMQQSRIHKSSNFLPPKMEIVKSSNPFPYNSRNWTIN